MSLDNLHISLVGDRQKGVSLVPFAVKKLLQLSNVSEFCGDKTVHFAGATIVLSTTKTRKNIIITIPQSSQVKLKSGGSYTGETDLLFFYGMPFQELVLAEVDGTFLAEPVICDSGYGVVVSPLGNSLIGEFTNCEGVLTGSTSGATGVVAACNKRIYKRNYTSHILTSAFTFSPGWQTLSPADYFNVSCATVTNDEFRTHTKTIGSKSIGWFTITAVEVKVYLSGIAVTLWFLCGKMNGQRLQFDGQYSTATYTKDLSELSPILFDVWIDGENVFASTVDNLLTVYRYSPAEKQFLTVSAENIPFSVGHAKQAYYYTTSDTDESIVYYGDSAEVNSDTISGEILSTLWNHFNDTLYILTREEATNEATVGNVYDTTCLYIKRYNPIPYYASCYYACDGTITGCEGAYCDRVDIEDWCGEPVMYGAIIDLSSNGYPGVEIPVFIAWESGYVTWTTYHRVTVYKGMAVATSPIYAIHAYKDGKAVSTTELPYGVATTYTSIDHVFTRNADYWYSTTISAPGYNGYQNSYTLDDWVFTADATGYYAKFTETKTINSVAQEPTILLKGNSKYAPGSSPRPYDHNWTAILKAGSQDMLSRNLSAALVYVNGETEENLFYGIGNSVVDLPDKGNRAFFMADKRYKINS